MTKTRGMNHYRPFVPCRALLPVIFLICRYFHCTLFLISFLICSYLFLFTHMFFLFDIVCYYFVLVCVLFVFLISSFVLICPYLY